MQRLPPKKRPVAGKTKQVPGKWIVSADTLAKVQGMPLPECRKRIIFLRRWGAQTNLIQRLQMKRKDFPIDEQEFLALTAKIRGTTVEQVLELFRAQA